ncbi:MAG: GNAT family N-acetyltransferase [Alphaproteobacteria bacterium]|nr:GNAT family N-acetyltransferase [Alphaproteobacteria bacterium]
MTPCLETPRLRLRSPGFGDARRLTEFLDNFAVSGNLAKVPHPYTIEDARTWLSAWRADAPPRETRFVVELRDEGAIGMVGFRDCDGEAMVGYWLGEPHWGQGLMTEALCAALDWYFAVTDADVVVSGVFHFNMASAALQMKFGFVETGRSMSHCLARGQELEHIDTELTREAYELSRPKPKRIAAQ